MFECEAYVAGNSLLRCTKPSDQPRASLQHHSCARTQRLLGVTLDWLPIGCDRTTSEADAAVRE